MRVVLSWLKDYVDLSGVSVEALAERWTLAGLEVEAIERVGDWWDRERLLVGAITRVAPHPDADRLVLAMVDFGGDAPHQVVTGAPNLLPLREAGDLERPMKIVFATEGVEIYDGYKEGWVKTKLKGRNVRGVMSDAMVCSEKEIGLSDDHSGIIVLDDDAPVGAPLADVLGETVIEIDVTPNLARVMNMVGVARETAAILERPFQAPAPALPDASGDVAEWVDVVIEAPDLCPRYTARVIRDVQIGPSPFWMSRRLTLAGMRPINNIVDITNYAMLEWGEPLHAFDYDRLVERADGAKPRITVRRAQPGERMTTLDDVDRELDPDTLLICDAAGPVAIGGVMGGADGEVGDATRNVLLEAAAFDFINIRRTSRHLRLPSESAARFGRGVHPALALPGSTRAAELLADLAGGDVVHGVVDAYPRPPEPVVVALAPAEIERVLGLAIPIGEAVGALERLAFDVALTEAGAIEATVPPHRMDVQLPADLLEEIARIYGYDRLPSTLLADPLPPQRDNLPLALEEEARDALVAAGLQEIISYRPLAVEREADLTPERDVDPDPAGYVTLANPISPERSSLRRSLLTGLLESASANLRFADRVALFEVGPVFHARDEGLPDEPRRVGLVLAGPGRAREWRGGEQPPMDFYDAKGAVETLFDRLGVEAAWMRGAHPSMHPGRTARVCAGEVELGFVGELHPLVSERWGLAAAPVAVADLDLDAIQRVAEPEPSFRSFSPYPAVVQDLAVVVGTGVPAADVGAVIRAAAGPLLVDLRLFDIYRGMQVGRGRKSLAWSLTYQAPDKTLKGKTVEKLRARIVRQLEEELGAELR